VESRRAAADVNQQSASGQAVGEGASGGAAAAAGNGLTGFEAVLKRVDDYLGGAS
jgi:hypothetical protein